MKRERVGVLGGTFDPVHVGHLEIAERVRRELLLAHVLLVPSATPPHKAPGKVTLAIHRLAMLRLALLGRDPGLEVSTAEIERGGTSFTIDTLRSLRDERELDPVFILGMDSLLEISTWRDYERLLEEFDFVVVDRSNGGAASASRLEPKVASRMEGQAPGGRIFQLRMQPIPISSREIRERAARGAPLDGLVPPAVARYIQEQGLYQEEGNR